jgi:N-acetyl-gamma-glutamyl-phosphate reductase
MAKFKVFIDGNEGTTGLELQRRLERHEHVELLQIDQSLRKDTDERRRLINSADVVFLCLPDAAAVEAVSLVENDAVRVIDASTAHRVAPGWDYGLPELSAAHRARIAGSHRIANPGCHATGFISIVYPLVAMGIASRDYPFTCHSITGYSGGGKKMIAQYGDAARPATYDSPRQYGLGGSHKHLPEMQTVTGIAMPPVFNPIVCDFYSGMAVSVPLHPSLLAQPVTVSQLRDSFAQYYTGQRLISVAPVGGDTPDGTIAANELAGTCQLRLYVVGNDALITVVSVFDNLGKGASGAAVQNMNICLGLDECTSLM